MKRLFAVLAVLPLLAACEDEGTTTPPAAALEQRRPAAEYSMNIGGSTLVVAEFIPAQDSDDICIYVSPSSTWDGSAQDCFARAASGQLYQGTTGPVTYTMPLGGSKMVVLEFSPQTAPHMNCVYMSPSNSWKGSTLKCTLR